ncbi:MAG: hypothetical protein ABL999_09430 [Pyrinomonadaceae bacterium]
MKSYQIISGHLTAIVALLLFSLNASGQSAEYQERYKFFSEARKYESSVLAFTVVYDPKLMSKMSSTYYPPTEAAKWNEVMGDLAELDEVCKKYPNLKNPPGRQTELVGLAKSWCEIAANRVEMRKKAVQVGAEYELRNRTQNRIYDMENAMRNNFESVLDDYQMMVFEPEAHRQKMAAELQAEYAKRGAQLPNDFYNKYAEIAPKMKTLIEQSVATRTWTMPVIKDAALESLMRGQYAKNPAVAKATVLKVGFVASTWASVDDMNWISTTGNVSLYRIEKNKHRFRRGYVLVRMPNRPECQAREFVLRQDRKGGGFGATKVEDLGAGGIFIKCP